MYNKVASHQPIQSSPTLSGTGPRPPAQRPSEFAQALVGQGLELNDRLAHLSGRLFGDGEHGKSEPLPGNPEGELPLEQLVHRAHFLLNEAISRLDAIQSRL
jgi:hypothetical protein